MKPIEQKKLTNGCTLTIWDQSRNIAVDRWLVKLRCETEVPVREEFFSGIDEDDPELLRKVRGLMGSSLIFSTEKERNFIDAAEKDQILKLLVKQACDALLVYLANPKFPVKMFKKRFQELKDRCLFEQHSPGVNRAIEIEDEEGPADFSACFLDRSSS